MEKSFAPRVTVVAILAALASPAWSAETASLEEVVVTAPRMEEPLTVTTDPKAPQQPVPANDGAAYLKNIPGFNVIRKGGTDGDPVLRGLAGSRLNVLLDGADFHGGCGMRMDPPTAYVFPETFDRVSVIKGPQTVLHGNGNAAGVVLFERDERLLTQAGGHGFASLMAGAWGRLDAVAGGGWANDRAYLQATASHAESDDYQDGAGNDVHAAYRRQNLSGIAGWTPDKDTRVEFSATGSRAEAAYADRSMDGVKFDRESYGLKLEKKNLGTVLQALKAQLNYTYIDHVMDNYSLRANPVGACMGVPPMGPGCYMVNNPDRETQSARVSADLAVSDASLLTAGVDWQGNEHTLRKGSAPAPVAYQGLPRILDMETDIRGLFAELRHDLAGDQRLIGGARLDSWSADRYNASTATYLAGAEDTLKSGFLRYERDLSGRPATVFVGLGLSQRPMDYWEASTYNGLTAAAGLNPEQNTQLDAGLIWKNTHLNGSVSVYYSKINDYILTYSNQTLPSPRTTMAGHCVAAMSGVFYCSGNVDATRYGGEADLAWRFADQWTLRGTIAYSHADNNTDNVPLAQTPPLEGRLGLDYKTGAWTLGGVWRLVAEQNRVDPGYGSIVGQDLGRTAGFGTLALNAAYQPRKQLLLSGGIDNVFDRNYAEHINRAVFPSVAPLQRVNEPGRFIWAKLNYQFD